MDVDMDIDMDGMYGESWKSAQKLKYSTAVALKLLIHSYARSDPKTLHEQLRQQDPARKQPRCFTLKAHSQLPGLG